MTPEEIDAFAKYIVEENTITADEETKKRYAHFFTMGYNMNTIPNFEDLLLFVFVHGGTKYEENKDSKMLAKNFKELLETVKITIARDKQQVNA